MMTFGKAFQLGLASGSLVLWLVITSSAPGAEILEILARAKPAIVQIFCFDKQGNVRTGTGFFVSANGAVVTNFHVVALALQTIHDSEHIYAKTASGDRIRLKNILFWSFNPDLAVLTFDTKDTPFLDLKHSSAAQEGQRVLVIGNPEGLYGTVSDGIISAFRDGGNIIQITAPISHGSSGSPVLNENGQVIGIAAAISKEGQNLNFAISSDALMSLIDRQHEDWNDAKSLIAPAKTNDLRDAQNKVDKAYHDLLELLSPEDKVLLVCDQFLWVDMRLILCRANSTGFCALGYRRAVELGKLCVKYASDN